MTESLLGTLANLIQVAGGLATLFFFFVPPDLQRKAVAFVITKAEWLSSMTWRMYIRRASLRSARLLAKLYGAPGSHGASWRRYVTRRAFRTSGIIATTYLVLGALAFVAFNLASGQAADKGILAKTFGGAVLVFCAVGVGWAWKRALRRRLESASPDEKLSALVRCALLSVALPMLASSALYGARAWESNSAVVLVFGVLCIIYPIYAGIRGMVNAFDIFLPIGLLLFLPVSASVTAATLDLAPSPFPSSGVRAGTLDALNMLSLAGLLLLVPVSVPKFAKDWPRVFRLFAVLGVAACSAPLTKYGHSLFSTVIEPGVTVASMHFALGTCIATIAAVVYANAMCDLLSVAFTRRLLVPMSRARTARHFWEYFGLDLLLAIALVCMTYLTFVAMTHAFVMISTLPGDDFLGGLRSLESWFVSTPPDGKLTGKELSRQLGSGLGKFAFMFGLSATLPTVLHCLLIAGWAGVRLTLEALAVPARLLVRRWRNVAIESADSSVRALLESWLIGGLSFVVLVVAYMVGRVLERLFGP